MRDTLVVLAAIGVVALLEGGFHLLRFLRERKTDELRRRLRALESGGAGPNLLRAGRLSRIGAVHDLLSGFPPARRLERLLEQADVGITVGRLLAYCVAGAAGAVVVSVALALGLLVGALLSGAAATAPVLVILVIRGRRSRRLSEQLPDALEMMARSLRAGHALTAAFQLVASEMPEPINLEFGRAYEEQRLGRRLDEAMVALSSRAPGNADLRILAVSVIVQRETGGNLAEILDKIAETVRARYRFYGKLRALTAEGRMSGIILAVLPLAMVAFMALANPAYLARLLQTQLGRCFLAYAVGSWGLGIVWMYRMTKVEI